jgi:hypothetical protein
MLKAENDCITASKIASKFGIDYTIAETLLVKILNTGIIEEIYIIDCPQCEKPICSTIRSRLLDDMKSITYCYRCDKPVDLSVDNVIIAYKIIKKPSISEEELREYTKSILVMNEEATSDDRLIERLKKGDTVTRKIRTGTNQLDCTVRNGFDIKCTVYSEIGSILIAECKNEEGTPGNSYYHKLADIINSCKSPGEHRIGILFSRDPIARTCKEIAREKFLQNNIVLVNISNDELDKIVNRKNFLVILQGKIQEVKLNIKTKSEKHKLYEA